MQSYSTIVGVLSLRQDNVGYRTIGGRYGIGNSTITLITTRYKELGLTMEKLKTMAPQEVVEAFYPPENLRHTEKVMPDFESIHQQMMKMDHQDLSFIWLEYKEKNPDGYQLTQFYKLYGDFLRENYGQENVSMPVERIPGERMYIDWVGDQPALLVDADTGEARKIHIFLTTMGFSSYVYAEIFTDEKTPHFIAGVVHAIEFYGAVPKYLVPDNLKTAITKHTKDELELNAVFEDLQDFYDAIVLPPPPRKPKGKPSVENHVRYLETYLIEKLKEDAPYTNLASINRKTHEIIEAINERDFQNKKDPRKSRKYAFETFDKPRMRPLPGGSFTPCEYKYFSRVPDSYHLEFDGHYYSVLYTYHNKPAMLKATMTEVIICDENNRYICHHERSYNEFPRYITDDSHMPPQHRFYKEANLHDGAYYRRWASVYGQSMMTLIDRVLKSCKYEEQAYNSCNGILHMCDDVPKSIVAEAADACVKASACKYSYFKKALGRARNTPSQSGTSNSETLPEHENIRGKESYQ